MRPNWLKWILYHLEYRFQNGLFQFKYLTVLKWQKVLEEFPFDERLSARWLCLRIRQDCDRRQGLIFGEFRGCVCGCSATHRHGHPTVWLYADPIIQMTAHEKIPEAIRGILIHELCHWIGLSDECAYKVGSDPEWFRRAMAHLRLDNHPPH